MRVTGPGEDQAPPPEVGAPLRASLDRVLRSLGGSSDSMVVLSQRWDEVAGPALAARSGPAGLSDGILTVLVTEPAFVSEVRFSSASIVAGAARVLGSAVVTGVEVRVRRPDGATGR